MPSATSISTFIRDLRERTSEITRKMDACSTDTTSGPTNCRVKVREAIAEWNPANDPDLPDGVRTALGLTPAEVQHINQWPTPRKSEVRNAVWTATDPNAPRAMQFFWELHEGASDNPIVVPAAPAPITVTFRSPRQNVRKSPVTFGAIEVDI